MPGIAGVISTQPPEACRPLVEQMIATMRHESFYASGTYAAPELGVFAGWAALENSFADCQPIRTERDDIVLLLSGECYADRETYAQLRQRGHRLEDGKASWLIPLYEEKGDSFFEQLNGLFSGLLIDRRIGRAHLFNDRFGMERLYYHDGPDGFFFASEAKALLRVLPQLRGFDNDALAEYLTYGCTLGAKSLFRGVLLLPGASSWCFTTGACEKRRYFSPESWESQETIPPRQFADELQDTLARVLPRYFEFGKIGVSLTAGLDTRMIMTGLPERPDNIVSYTFAGTTGETLDAQLASRVAAECGVQHSLIRITSAFFSEFASLADRTVYITDGSFGVCGAHEIFLNNRARHLAPIRVTGNFGSEILRAVTTLKPLGLSPDLLDPDVRRSLSSRSLTFDHDVHPVSFSAFYEIPFHLSGVVRAAQSQVGWRTPYLDNDIVALAFRASPRIRHSSAAALQVIRRSHVGLSRIETDAGLVPASWLSSCARYPWARISFKLDYWYGDGMPDWLVPVDSRLSQIGVRLWTPGLHKYLHYPRWFRKELSSYIRERLTDPTTFHNGLWDRRTLHRLIEDHIAGRRNYLREIDVSLTLGAIDRLLLRAS
jgi:asparagine synthase (glutamine-hydrolysing)